MPKAFPCHDVITHYDVTFDFRWYEYSSAPDDERRVEEAIENIRFYYAHVMNGVRFLFYVNSLAPGRFGSNFRIINFKLIARNSILGTRREIALM